MSEPVSTQILDALVDQIRAQAKAGGVRTIDVERDNESEPYAPEELPALNVIPVEESVVAESQWGAAVGVSMLQDVELTVVLQLVSRGGVNPAREARRLSALCEQLVALEPTLGGVCHQLMRVTGRQWLRDDGTEQRLARMNTRYVCGYRTQSTDPNTSI